MVRHLIFAITFIGVGVLGTPSAEAALDAARCQDRAANCVGRCHNPFGGANQNKCMWYCDRHVTSCLERAHGPPRFSQYSPWQ
jgi:hypothetical protein